MSKLLWERQIPAFCGLGTEQPFKADQAGPVPNGCGQWRHTPHPLQLQIIHSQHPGSSLGIASTLLRWVSLASVQSKRSHTPRKTMELRKENRNRFWFWACSQAAGSQFPPVEKEISYMISKVPSSSNVPWFSPSCLRSSPWVWEPCVFYESPWGKAWGLMWRRRRAMQPLAHWKRSSTSKAWGMFLGQMRTASRFSRGPSGNRGPTTLLQSKECLQYCLGTEGNPQCSLALLKNKQKNAVKLVCIKHRVWIVTFLFQVRTYHLVAHGTMRVTCLQRYQWSLDPQLYQRRDIWLQCPISTSSHQIHKLPFLLGYILTGSQDRYPGNNWYPCYYSPVRESDTGREA